MEALLGQLAQAADSRSTEQTNSDAGSADSEDGGFLSVLRDQLGQAPDSESGSLQLTEQMSNGGDGTELTEDELQELADKLAQLQDLLKQEGGAEEVTKLLESLDQLPSEQQKILQDAVLESVSSADQILESGESSDDSIEIDIQQLTEDQISKVKDLLSEADSDRSLEDIESLQVDAEVVQSVLEDSEVQAELFGESSGDKPKLMDLGGEEFKLVSVEDLVKERKSILDQLMGQGPDLSNQEILKTLVTDLEQVNPELSRQVNQELKSLDSDQVREVLDRLIDGLETAKMDGPSAEQLDQLVEDLEKLTDQLNQLQEGLGSDGDQGFGSENSLSRQEITELVQNLEQNLAELDNQIETVTSQLSGDQSGDGIKQLVDELKTLQQDLKNSKTSVVDFEAAIQRGDLNQEELQSRLKEIMRSIRSDRSSRERLAQLSNKLQSLRSETNLEKLIRQAIGSSDSSTGDSNRGQREALQFVLQQAQNQTSGTAGPGADGSTNFSASAAAVAALSDGSFGGVDGWGGGVSESGESIDQLSDQAQQVLQRSLSDGLQTQTQPQGVEPSNSTQQLKPDSPIDRFLRRILLGGSGSELGSKTSDDGARLGALSGEGRMSTPGGGDQGGRLQSNTLGGSATALSGTADGQSTGFFGGGSGNSSGGRGQGGFGSTGSAGGSGSAGRRMQAQQIAQQVIQQTQTMVNDNQQTMRLQLQPEQLGQVQMEVAVDSNKVSLQFGVENNTVKQALNDQMMALQQTLEEMGLSLDEADVYDMSQDEGGGFEEWFDDDGPSRMNPRGAEPGAEESGEDETSRRRRRLREYSTFETVG